MKPKFQKVLKNSIFLLVVLIVLSIIGLVIFVLTPYRATDKALDKFFDAQQITLNSQNFYYFSGDTSNDDAFIVYPGGRVEIEAYSILCEQLAAISSGCLLVQMPFNFAFLPTRNSLSDTINNIEQVRGKSITTIGHSLGGPFLIRDILDSDYTKIGIKKLVLLGSFSDIDITDIDLEVISLIGDQDMLSLEMYDQNLHNLPSTSQNVVVEGANHAGWGDYGRQRGDGQAIISPSDQKKFLLNILQPQESNPPESTTKSPDQPASSLTAEEQNSIRFAVTQGNLNPPVGTTGDSNSDQKIIQSSALIWEEYKLVSPPEYLDFVDNFEIFNSEASDTSAFVESMNEDSSKWRLSVNLDSVFVEGELDLGSLSETLIHEFAHVLSLNNTQQNIDYFSCTTLEESEGCLENNSYLYRFYERFYQSSLPNTPENFVTDYASTELGEDFAESFVYFVYSESDQFCCIAKQKVEFFESDPELVRIKDFIQRNYSI